MEARERFCLLVAEEISDSCCGSGCRLLWMMRVKGKDVNFYKEWMLGVVTSGCQLL